VLRLGMQSKAARVFWLGAAFTAAGVLGGCGGGDGSAAGGSSDGPHAEITRCYVGASGLPAADVVLSGANDSGDPTYNASVNFRVVGEPQYNGAVISLANLTTFGDTAEGTAEVVEVDPIEPGEPATCVLTELTHLVYHNGEETPETIWSGEGPEVEEEG
jgi:hypothetical protein